MSSGILSEIYQSDNNEVVIRQNALEVWHDFFSYAKNLKGNWMISQEIFNNRIAPTAINHPDYFADCVVEMVKTSGVKIKYRSLFTRSIKVLKKVKNKTLENEIIITALTDLINAGLYEPLYAERALRTSNSPVIA